MQLRIIRKDGRAYAELPPEFANENDIELFQLKSGYYLLSVPIGTRPRVQDSRSQGSKEPGELVASATGHETRDFVAQNTGNYVVQNTQLDQAERKLLDKLLAVKFEKRTPDELDKALNIDEKRMIKSLIDRRCITVFSSKKYPNGVYNISDKAYAMLKQRNISSPASSVLTNKPYPRPNAQDPKATYVDPFYAQLQQKGFMVLQSNVAASETLRGKVRAGEIIGVKSFDGRTYAVTKLYFMKLSALMTPILKKASKVDELAKTCEAPEEGCMAVLAIMAERGDVLEKRKNLFALA